MINTHNKKMNVGLWTAQLLVAGIFILAGGMKTFQPIDKLAEMLPWVASTSEIFVRFIGISELLGAMGLVLPSLLRIMPKLTVWAAMGLATVMVFAMIFHIGRGEYESLGVNVVIFILTIFIAWGRSKKVPVLAKG